MRVNKYHTHDEMSVLELETPLQSYKEELGQEAYAQATEFYKSDEWKKVERDHLNSDRRYISLYEEAKAFGYPGLVNYNYKRILKLFEQCKIIFSQNESPDASSIQPNTSNNDPAA